MGVPRLLRIAGASYLVLLVFAAGYFGSAWINEGLGTAFRVTVGTLVAAPLAVAFLWDRLKSVKALGIEIELTEVSEDVPPLGNPALEDAFADQQYFSGEQAILDQMTRAVRAKNKRVLEINLRSKPYWWSTRLYLQAALLLDHSEVSHLVFVEGDEERRYVGIARTRHLCEALAESMPCLEVIYRGLSRQDVSVDDLVQQWVAAVFDGQPEIDAKTRISGKELREVLGDRLNTSAVQHSEEQGLEIFSEVLEYGERFVPVVREDRLELIVDADALARRLSRNALERAN